VPKTLEEKIVCHADNLIGSTERVSIRETVARARKKWFPEAVDRLINMHYEVFRPDIVGVKENAPAVKNGDLKGIEKYLDALFMDFDLLYKVKGENGKYAVALYGQDSKKAAKYLLDKGIAERI